LIQFFSKFLKLYIKSKKFQNFAIKNSKRIPEHSEFSIRISPLILQQKSQFVDQQISPHKHNSNTNLLNSSLTLKMLTEKKSNTFSNLFVQIQQKYSKTFSIHVYNTQSHDFIVCLTTTTKWSSPTASISSHADYVEKNSLLQSQSKHQRDDIEILNAENKIKSLFKRIFY